MRKKKLDLTSPIKENGAIQRSHVSLTKKIAGALLSLARNGVSMRNKRGYVDIEVTDENGENMAIQLSCNTIKSWCDRGIVIPETNEVFKEL